MAERWAYKAHSIMHALEPLLVQITEDEEEMLSAFCYANYWYLNRLFYMGIRLMACDGLSAGLKFTQAISQSIASMYELVFPNDDMGFEDLRNLCMLHKSIAEDEIRLGMDENRIKHHLNRALACAEKSVMVKDHVLEHPLVMGWHVNDAPSDSKQIVHLLRNELSLSCFDAYRHNGWFVDLEKRIACQC